MTSDFEFRLTTYVGEHHDSDVDIGVTFAEKPTEEAASNALLFGLAILMLDETGAIDELMLDICKDGVPSEAEAISRIELLLCETVHETRN